MLVLIKAVLNSLPMYYLSIFKIPKTVALKLIRLQRDFFLFVRNDRRGSPLVAWEITQRPKVLGGLGVGDPIVKIATLLFQ